MPGSNFILKLKVNIMFNVYRISLVNDFLKINPCIGPVKELMQTNKL